MPTLPSVDEMTATSESEAPPADTKWDPFAIEIPGVDAVVSDDVVSVVDDDSASDEPADAGRARGAERGSLLSLLRQAGYDSGFELPFIGPIARWPQSDAVSRCRAWTRALAAAVQTKTGIVAVAGSARCGGLPPRQSQCGPSTVRWSWG